MYIHKRTGRVSFKGVEVSCPNMNNHFSSFPNICFKNISKCSIKIKLKCWSSKSSWSLFWTSVNHSALRSYNSNLGETFDKLGSPAIIYCTSTFPFVLILFIIFDGVCWLFFLESSFGELWDTHNYGKFIFGKIPISKFCWMQYWRGWNHKYS